MGGNQADQGGFLGASHLAGVGIRLLRLANLGGGEALGAGLFELVDEARFHLRHVHRIATHGRGEERRVAIGGKGGGPGAPRAPPPPHRFARLSVGTAWSARTAAWPASPPSILLPP